MPVTALCLRLAKLTWHVHVRSPCVWKRAVETVATLSVTDSTVQTTIVTSPCASSPAVGRFRTLPLPIKTIISNRIISTRIIANLLGALIRHFGFPHRGAVLICSDHHVIFHRTSFPCVSLTSLHSALPFRTGNVVPLPVRRSRLSFIPLSMISSRRGNGRLRNVLMTALHNNLRGATCATRRTNFIVASVSTNPFTLTHLFDSAGRTRARTIIGVGNGYASIVILGGKGPTCVHIIPSNTSSISSTVTGTLDVSFRSTRHVGGRVNLRGIANSRHLRGTRRIVHRAATRLVINVHGALGVCSISRTSDAVDNVVLANANTQLVNLPPILTDSVGGVIHVNSPFVHFGLSGRIRHRGVITRTISLNKILKLIVKGGPE